MKTLLSAILVGALAGGLYASCVGPYCFNESGASVTSKATVEGVLTLGNVLQMPAYTYATISVSTPTAVGQLVYCSDCITSHLCISTSAVSTNSWIVITTNTVSKVVCQ